MGKLRIVQHGVIVCQDPGADLKMEVGTVQCVHCGAHFEITPQTKKGRGWCGNCAGFICGAGCLECVPEEQQLENLEADRPQLTKRIIVPGGFET